MWGARDLDLDLRRRGSAQRGASIAGHRRDELRRRLRATVGYVEAFLVLTDVFFFTFLYLSLFIYIMN
jgi:hypothetical protein